MMDNCCGGMGIFMWLGLIVLFMLLVLLLIWVVKQIRK